MRSFLGCLVCVLVGSGCGGVEGGGPQSKPIQPARYVLKSACRSAQPNELWVNLIFGAAPGTDSATDVLLTLPENQQEAHFISHQEDIHVMVHTQGVSSQFIVTADTWHELTAQPVNPDGHFTTTVNALDCP